MDKSIFKILKWGLICSIATFTCIFLLVLGLMIIMLTIPSTEIGIPFSFILMHVIVVFGLSALILSIISLRMWKSQPNDIKKKLRGKLIFVLIASFIGLVSFVDLIFMYISFHEMGL